LLYKRLFYKKRQMNASILIPNSVNGATIQNPAYVRWVHSMPDNLQDADLVAWMKANPPPPKTVLNLPPGLAAYIQQEVSRQVASALANSSPNAS
jgi:hypothetical protein